MIDDISVDVARTVRRSRVRWRVLTALASHERLHVHHLAELARTSPRRVWDAMIGDGVDFRRELGLILLGLAVHRWTPNGGYFEITQRGTAAAGAWASFPG